jgi:hypothetical protein
LRFAEKGIYFREMPGIDLKKLFLCLLIASVVACAVIGMAVILFGSFGEFETKVLLTAVTITVTSILGLICGAALEERRNKVVPAGGIIFAIFSAILWLVLIWGDPIESDLYVKSLMCATVLGESCSHISLLSLARLDTRFRWARYAAHISIWLSAVYLIFLIWNPGFVDHDLTGRVLGVLGIVVASLTIVTPILHKLSSGTITLDAIDSEIAELKERLAGLENKKSTMLSRQQSLP